jgi:hypothetical protein
MVSTDKEVIQALKVLVKTFTGQEIKNGYPYVEGDVLVFRDGKSQLEKRNSEFSWKYCGKTIIPFSDSDTFIDHCADGMTAMLSASGLKVEELEIPE